MGKSKSFEAQQVRLSLITSIPLFSGLVAVMIYADISIWLVLLVVVVGSIVMAYANYRIHQNTVYQFRTLNNLLVAMIEGDFSLRAHSDQNYSALDELVKSINGLAQRLSQHRSESVESQLLLRVVIDHIVVAIVALTEDNQVSFSNPAAKRFNFPEKGEIAPEILQQLSFVQDASSGYNRVFELSLGDIQGRFHIHIEEFRESGIHHKLLFITDVGTLLRSEERKAWQRLVRVISHEINNSLSPIASISHTLTRLVGRMNRGDELDKNLTEGLTIIAERADGLQKFIESYKQLAKLPEPNKQTIAIRALVEKARFLFKEHDIRIADEKNVLLPVDPVQVEQVLINLIKNAAESLAQSNPGGAIHISWTTTNSSLKLVVMDEGRGVSNPDNLFVPFYSTKKNGSGIGLVLCRQIVEAHGGYLMISNRTDAPGVCAAIELPLE